ncbi:MAG TPA: alpha/beta fold hydrolase [Aldersonia sp.]
MRGSRWNRAVAVCAATAALALGPTPAASAAPDLPTDFVAATVPVAAAPTQFTHGDAIRYDKRHPDSAPPGINDFACTPSPAHPKPVILVHGTDSSAYSDWALFAPMLHAAGYCVYAPNFGRGAGGDYGTADVVMSAHQLGDFVDHVRTQTGAAKVDVVGYSLGATVARYWVNLLGGGAVTDRWVGIASPTYGGTIYGTSQIFEAIPGGVDLIERFSSLPVVQQLADSAFLAQLNGPGDTVPGVRYTTIASRVDEIIQPVENIALRDPAATNIVVQDLCPIDLTGHFNLVYDRFSLQLVLNTLDPEHSVVPPCEFVPLGTGIAEVALASNF